MLRSRHYAKKVTVDTRTSSRYYAKKVIVDTRANSKYHAKDIIVGLSCNVKDLYKENIRRKGFLLLLVIVNLNSSFSYLDYN